MDCTPSAVFILLWIMNSFDKIVLGVNLALRKETFQPTTNSIFSSERAVDGILTEYVNGEYTCTHTTGGYQRWWVVDLGDTYNITNVIIYNRQGIRSSWLENYDIDVFTEPVCFCDKWATFTRGRQSRCNYQSASVLYLNATCKEESIGRFVRIRLRNNAPLCLCEVEVNGQVFPDSTFSSSSREACGFPNMEYTGINMKTVTADSNVECTIMCVNTYGCCAGVFDKSTKVCTLKRKTNENEITTHSFEDNQFVTSWLI